MGIFKTIRLIKLIVALAILLFSGVVLVGFIGCALIMGTARNSNRSGASARASAPGESAFDKANAQINIYNSSTKKTAFGNTPEAIKLATDFNKRISFFEKLMFKGGSKDGPSLSGRNFLTYCHATDEKICFLVHVPQLRNYKQGKVRDALLKIGWLTGKSVTEKLCKDKPRKLAVGLRGSMAYGAIAIGKTDGDPVNKTGFIVSDGKLYPFFVEPRKKAPPPAAAESKP